MLAEITSANTQSLIASALGLGAELVTQHAEAAGGVAEAAGDFVGGQCFDEVGAQGFVLAVRGVAGPHEVAGKFC